MSSFSCSSPCPTRSPASPCDGHIDSRSGKVALRDLNSKVVPSTLQFRQVSTKPALSMKPQASHGARARHTRHSQVAIASDTARAVNFMQPLDRWLTEAHLQRPRGAARRRAASGEAAKRRHDVAQAYDRGCGAQAACGERRVACLCGPLAGCLWRVWRKVGDVSGAIARVSVGLRGSG